MVKNPTIPLTKYTEAILAAHSLPLENILAYAIVPTYDAMLNKTEYIASQKKPSMFDGIPSILMAYSTGIISIFKTA